jgi:hypothetical protein
MPSASYRLKLATIITKGRLYCSLPALSGDEMMLLVNTWAEVLIRVIPEARLDECYFHAMANKTSTFPPAAPDLVAAYEILRSAEKFRVKSLPRPEDPEDVCENCFDSGYEIVRIDGKTYSRSCNCNMQAGETVQ